jgi:predicted DNA binding CopG/RHH family protein
MSLEDKLKPLPRPKTDDEAERFVSDSDLTEYGLSGFVPVRFEFERKTARVNMRLPEPLLNGVKAKAQALGIPYQRFIREAIERAVSERNP